MIRYSISLYDLVNRINALKPTWIKRAYERTQLYITAKDFTGGTDFWGEIKSIYIELQHEKCAYCETKLQGAMLASKVHEVEHYRPKQSVAAWPNNNISYWAGFKPSWPVGQESKTGYYKLAYHPLNYAIACTRCNSTLKSNYFPVRGKRKTAGDHPSKMLAELPLLVYPISSVDPDDPADLITFQGVLAVPKHSSGAAYERAITNIEFFQLNHEDLTSRRAQEISKLWMALEEVSNPRSKKSGEKAKKIAANICSPSSQFTSCMNAFRKLYQNNYVEAEQIADLIIDALR